MINLELMKLRAQHMNNDRQHERMVQDKLRSFHRALLYSYQTAWIKKDGDEEAEYIRALINPDKVKFDYDEKLVSIDSIHGFKTGDTFEWKGTGTHWIILKQELTEVAYFRGSIRRCQALEAIDTNGNKYCVWMAVRGPVETQINTIQKAGLTIDVPNLSLNIYVPLNDTNLNLFQRYKKFQFANKTWEVTGYDYISTPNILEFTAVETYNCDHLDFNLEEKPEINSPEIEQKMIGETFVRPLVSTTYTMAKYIAGCEWKVDLPAEKNKDISEVLIWNVNEDKSITIKWIAMFSGSFILRYGDLEKAIVVESLF